MKKFKFAVKGMHCQGCAAKVKNAALAAAGAKAAQVDLKSGMLTVDAEENFAAGQVVSAVENLGFAAKQLVVVKRIKRRTWYTLYLGTKTVDVYGERD